MIVCLSCALAVRAEIIDRIVAVVEGQIITLSDVRKERLIRAALGEKPIDDDSALAKELIDTHLIELQIANSPNIDVTDADVDTEIAKLNLQPEVDLKAVSGGVRQRIQIRQFFDTRFRQLIRPTDEEIRKYYEEVFVPEARKRGLQSIPNLTEPEMEAAIRENVIQEKLDRDVEAWLESIRRRSSIEIFQ